MAIEPAPLSAKAPGEDAPGAGHPEASRPGVPPPPGSAPPVPASSSVIEPAAGSPAGSGAPGSVSVLAPTWIVIAVESADPGSVADETAADAPDDDAAGPVDGVPECGFPGRGASVPSEVGTVPWVEDAPAVRVGSDAGSVLAAAAVLVVEDVRVTVVATVDDVRATVIATVDDVLVTVVAAAVDGASAGAGVLVTGVSVLPGVVVPPSSDAPAADVGATVAAVECSACAASSVPTASPA